MPVSSRLNSRALPLFLAVSCLLHGMLVLIPARQSGGQGQNGTGTALAIQLTDWQGHESPQASQNVARPEKVRSHHPPEKKASRSPATVKKVVRPKSPPRPAEVPTTAAVSTPPVAEPAPKGSKVPTPEMKPIASVPAVSDASSGGEVEDSSSEPSQYSGNATTPAPAAAVAVTGAGQGNGSPAGAGGQPLRTRFGVSGGPQVVSMPRPAYPLRAKRLGKEGRVLLLLDIDHDGTLRKAEVLETAGFGFDEAALRAVRHARFRPAVEQGQTVACQAVLPVRFRLRPVHEEGSETNLF